MRRSYARTVRGAVDAKVHQKAARKSCTLVHIGRNIETSMVVLECAASCRCTCSIHSLIVKCVPDAQDMAWLLALAVLLLALLLASGVNTAGVQPRDRPATLSCKHTQSY